MENEIIFNKQRTQKEDKGRNMKTKDGDKW